MSEAFKQLDDFFECVEEEGLDRDLIHFAWTIHKEQIELLKRKFEEEIAGLKEQLKTLTKEEG